MISRETRSWRRLAIAGAGATILLTVRVLVSPQTPLFRLLHPEFWPRDRARWLKDPAPGETRDEEIERRLAACEEHLRNLPPERG